MNIDWRYLLHQDQIDEIRDESAEAQQYAKRMNPRKDDTNEPKDQSDGESPRRDDR